MYGTMRYMPLLPKCLPNARSLVTLNIVLHLELNSHPRMRPQPNNTHLSKLIRLQTDLDCCLEFCSLFFLIFGFFIFIRGTTTMRYLLAVRSQKPTNWSLNRSKRRRKDNEMRLRKHQCKKETHCALTRKSNIWKRAYTLRCTTISNMISSSRSSDRIRLIRFLTWTFYVLFCFGIVFTIVYFVIFISHHQ